VLRPWLLDVAHQQLGGPLVVVWDYVPRHIFQVLCPAVLCGQRYALVAFGSPPGCAPASAPADLPAHIGGFAAMRVASFRRGQIEEPCGHLLAVRLAICVMARRECKRRRK
jgi:hypothetical protein